MGKVEKLGHVSDDGFHSSQTDGAKGKHAILKIRSGLGVAHSIESSGS
jgi:hypothetical protein